MVGSWDDRPRSGGTALLATGGHPPGTRLRPRSCQQAGSCPVRQPLSQEYELSRGTVVTALDALARDGLMVRMQAGGRSPVAKDGQN
jgi:hypothetical protein